MSAARLQAHVPQSGELQREVIEILQQICRDFPNDLTCVAAALRGGACDIWGAESIARSLQGICHTYRLQVEAQR
eukprot:7382198-Prymnesium_polylepis.1